MKIISVLLVSVFLFSCSTAPVKKDAGTNGNKTTNIDRSDNNSIKSNGHSEKKSTFNTTLLPQKFYRKYIIKSLGFNGILVLSRDKQVLKGTIYYENWGKGVPIPIKSVKITDDKIYFIRSITSPEERAKYGGSRYFVQEYRGVIIQHGKKIKGNYIEGGLIIRWEAVYQDN